MSDDDMTHELTVGDCREILRHLETGSVDACVTDPPYLLGFMGKGWDKAKDNPAADQELWREVLRVLKPGGHLLAFGAPRTYHRVACAVEDAGFEVRDSLHWVSGQGMPKGGASLKPAHEPIVLARKPFRGSMRSCIEAHGTGGLQVDACRVPVTRDDAEAMARGVESEARSGKGRWPPNLLLTHHHDCLEGVCVEGLCPVREMAVQSGTRRSAGNKRPTQSTGAFFGVAGTRAYTPDELSHHDSGTAARYFPNFRYEPKASKRDRGEGNSHPTVKPVALMRWLVRLVTPPGGLVLDPFAGSGTTGVACAREGFRFLGLELSDHYADIARRRIEAAKQESPCLKTSPTPTPT